VATKSKAQIEKEQLQKQFDDFKKQVAETALRYKQDFDLCDDGFESFLADLDLEVPAKELEVRVKVTVMAIGDELDAEDEVYSAIDEAVSRLVRDNPSTFSNKTAHKSPFYGANYMVDSI
jgi:hypothetical protein